MSFTTTKLANSAVLVEGSDYRNKSGSTVLDGSVLEQLEHEQALSGAVEEFDSTINEFFSEIIEAADKLADAKVRKVQLDPLVHIVKQEPVEATAGQQGVIVELDSDTAILRAIAQDPDTKRVIWVGDDLVLTAYVPEPVEDVVEPTDDVADPVPSDLS